MRIMQIVVWGNVPALVAAATKEWPSISISANSPLATSIIELVWLRKGAAELPAKLLEVQEQLDALLCPEEAVRENWAGKYEVGWRNGAPFVRLFPNAGEDREVVFAFGHDQPSATIVFSRGSRIQGECVIRAFVDAGFDGTSLHADEGVEDTLSHFSSLRQLLAALTATGKGKGTAEPGCVRFK